jgi:hypothetical protein
MLTVVCAICGESVPSENEACPACAARDLRAVDESEFPATPQERLIANAHHTVEKINDLHTARAEQLDADSKVRIAQALRHRGEGQVSALEAQLRQKQADLRQEQEELDTALYQATLDRLKRELHELL